MLMLVDVGSQIASRRKDLGISQSDLATKARVSRATIDALENARWGELGFSKVNKILNVLGLELKIQKADTRRPTLEELIEENRIADGLC